MPGGPEAYPWMSSGSLNSSFCDAVQLSGSLCVLTLCKWRPTSPLFPRCQLRLPEAVCHVGPCTHPHCAPLASRVYSFCPSTGNTISAKCILFLGSSVLSAGNPPLLTAPRPPRSGHHPPSPRPTPPASTCSVLLHFPFLLSALGCPVSLCAWVLTRTLPLAKFSTIVL